MARVAHTNCSNLYFARCHHMAGFWPNHSLRLVNYDDNNYIYENPTITSGFTAHGIVRAFIGRHSGNWHPLATLSHMLDCELWGLRAGGHHVTNIVLHTIAVVLLFLVLQQMTGALWQSAFVAALFAIHPLRVESVAWISERKDVLSAVFFMLTLGAYIRYTRSPALSRYLAMSILFALGLMCKPMLMTAPFVLLLLDYWPLKRFAVRLSALSAKRLIFEKIPLFTLSAAAGVATLGHTNPVWRLSSNCLSFRKSLMGLSRAWFT